MSREPEPGDATSATPRSIRSCEAVQTRCGPGCGATSEGGLPSSDEGSPRASFWLEAHREPAPHSTAPARAQLTTRKCRILCGIAAVRAHGRCCAKKDFLSHPSGIM